MLRIGRAYRGKARSEAPVWGISIAILAILITLALVGTYLHGYVQDHLRSQALLFSIEEDAAEQAISEYEAIKEGELTPEIADGVAENRLELAEGLDELGRLNPGDEGLARVGEALSAYEAAVDEELRLIEAGQLEQADIVDEERVDPGFEALHEVLEDTSAQYGDDAQRADLIVDVATYGTALLAAITLIMVVRLWQREQSRRSEQEALRQSENRFRSLIRNASDIIMIMDAHRTVSYISPAVERVLGYKPEDIVGTDSYVPVHPDDRVRVQNLFADAVSKPGVTLAFELRLQHADGSWRHLESSCISLLHDPAVSGMVVNSRDTTERKRAEEELRRSEERFRAIFERAASGIALTDPDGSLLQTNAALEEMLGYSGEELRGKTFAELTYPEDVQPNLRLLRELLAGRLDRYQMEKRYVRKDGTLVWGHLTVSSIRNADGELRFVLGMVDDITERKRAEEALRRSEQRFRRVMEHAADALFVHDPQGRIVDVNQRASESLGYTREELLAISVPDFEINFDPTALANLWEKMLPGRPVTLDGIHRRKDGTTFPVEVRIGLFESEGRQLMLALVRDVTERKRAEELLQQQSAAMTASIDGMAILDQNGTYVYLNRAHAKVYGYDDPKELLGKTWHAFYDEEQLEWFGQHMMPMLEADGHWRGEAIGKKRDGSEFPQEVSITTIEGNGFVCVVRDITGRKRAEEEIRQFNENLEERVVERTAQLEATIAELKRSEAKVQASEAELRALFAAMNDVILVLDSHGRYLRVAPTDPSLLYRPSDELVGKTLHEVLPQEQADAFQDRIWRALQTQQPINLEYSLHIGGREVWFVATVSPMTQEQVVFVARDITERKWAEKELREAEELFRSTFGEAAVGMAVNYLDGRFMQVNRALCEILGYSEEELLRATFRDITHPKDFNVSVDQVQRVLEGKVSSYQLEKRYVHADGHPVWVSLNVSLVRDSEDHPLYLIAQMQDITERKRAEESLKAYAARLKQSNRELQDFAYVASHDLQEPLRKVRAFGDRLKAKYSEALGDQGRDYLERMGGAAARMQDLIDDLLTLSRVTTQARPFAPVDLGEVAQDVISDLEARIEQAGGQVEVGKLPTIQADRPQMRQLLQNLIGNALKFHKQGEAPAVKVHGRVLEDREEVRAKGPTGGEVCQILVEDNGIGFDEKYLERIFAPFQRLHGRAAYEGTGMGLAICRKVAERHGGEITAKSATGRGTTFVVTLPIKQSEKETRTARGEADDHATAGR